MIKKYKEIFNITIKAGNANTMPPIGPMFGQRGLNIMEFSKEFNNKTKHIKEQFLVPAQIIVNKNRTINLNIKNPTIFSILKILLNIQKGSSNPKHSNISSIKIQYLYEIIKTIYKTENPVILKKYLKIWIASAKSIGINITE